MASPERFCMQKRKKEIFKLIVCIKGSLKTWDFKLVRAGTTMGKNAVFEVAQLRGISELKDS